MVIDAAYHRALVARWRFYYPRRPWTGRGPAEEAFPECAARWRKVLDFLRGPELRAAVRMAADEQTVPHRPAYSVVFRTIRFFSPEQEKDAFALARLTADYVEQNSNIPCHLVRHSNVFQVLAETDAFGCAVLVYQTGVERWKLEQYCQDGNLDFRKLFWWVPDSTQPNDKINPCAAPVNTPDVNDTAAVFIWKEQHEAIQKVREIAAGVRQRLADAA